jgi:uncharacterized protein (DUF1800 family)
MLTPLNAKHWDFEKAAHLLNRAGFGGTPEEIEALHRAGFEAAVDRLLNAQDDTQLFPAPEWAKPRNVFQIREEMRQMTSDEERKMRQKEEAKTQREQMLALISWWLRRMQKSPNPLREKMTLFWHGHFATSAVKVRESYFMWLQNETLRQNALGNFGAMVKAISRDPAMMRWLDTNQSQRLHPNENFARELMELFTLGIGNYTEEDVKQAARAFTGYKLNPVDESFRFAPLQHDDGEKIFLGARGVFSGDDIIDRILQQPDCARFISAKLWKFFTSDEPKPAVVDTLATSLRGHKYEIRPLMREIFHSAEFYSPETIRTQVKSPVQWLVQSVKILETELPPPQVAANALRQLGQVPFAPPNVKGWDGGRAWITTSTLLLRYNFANFVVGKGPLRMRKAGKPDRGPDFDVNPQTQMDLAKIAPPELRVNPKALVAKLAMRLFQSPLSARDTEPFTSFLQQKQPDTSDETVQELLHLMMSTPQFQLT